MCSGATKIQVSAPVSVSATVESRTGIIGPVDQAVVARLHKVARNALIRGPMFCRGVVYEAPEHTDCVREIGACPDTETDEFGMSSPNLVTQRCIHLVWTVVGSIGDVGVKRSADRGR